MSIELVDVRPTGLKLTSYTWRCCNCSDTFVVDLSQELLIDDPSKAFKMIADAHTCTKRRVEMSEFKYESWMGEHPRQCAPWSKEEDKVLVQNFREGASLKELCVLHGRAKGGITSRIEKLTELKFYYALGNDDRPMENIMYNAATLIAQGYRRTSCKYCIVSRVDNKDWINELARQRGLSPADFYTETGDISPTWADFYRRTLSKDTLTVPEEVFKQIPGSTGDTTGYVEKEI